MVSEGGFEPPTYGVWVRCSANWATQTKNKTAFILNPKFSGYTTKKLLEAVFKKWSPLGELNPPSWDWKSHELATIRRGDMGESFTSLLYIPFSASHISKASVLLCVSSAGGSWNSQKSVLRVGLLTTGGYGRTRTYNLTVNSRLLHHWATYPWKSTFTESAQLRISVSSVWYDRLLENIAHVGHDSQAPSEVLRPHIPRNQLLQSCPTAYYK